MLTYKGDTGSETSALPSDERTPAVLIDSEREERLIRCARTLLGGPAADADAALLALFRVVAESEIEADSTYMATVKLDRVWAMRNAICAVYALDRRTLAQSQQVCGVPLFAGG
jgi:hypothetical protein